MHLDASEHGNELIFLHSVKPGPANQSYGLHVAQLAGVPRHVIEDAREYLSTLERQLQALSDSGPQGSCRSVRQLRSTLAERLAGLDVDDISPRQALALLIRANAAARAAGHPVSVRC